MTGGDHGYRGYMQTLILVGAGWCAASVAAGFVLGRALGHANDAHEQAVTDSEFRRLTCESPRHRPAGANDGDNTRH